MVYIEKCSDKHCFPICFSLQLLKTDLELKTHVLKVLYNWRLLWPLDSNGIYEAAILLDYYLKVENGDISRSEAVTIVSQILRQRMRYFEMKTVSVCSWRLCEIAI